VDLERCCDEQIFDATGIALFDITCAFGGYTMANGDIIKRNLLMIGLIGVVVYMAYRFIQIWHSSTF